MSDDKKGSSKVIGNTTSDVANWEQRIKNELESCHKWNEAWGEMFSNGVPFDYQGRIEYLRQELSKSKGSTSLPPKYGAGKPFKEIIQRDHRRRKFEFNRLPGEVDDE